MSTLPACLLATLAVALLGLAAWRLGSLLPDPAAVAEPATRLLAGFGWLGLGLFFIGMVHWSPTLVAMPVLPLAAFGLWNLLRRPGWRPFALRLGFWATAPLGAYLFLLALVPPMGVDDATAYHLLGPEVWLRTGHIAPVLDHSSTAFPATIEVLHGAAWALSNVRATGVLSLLWMALLLAQIWLLALDLTQNRRVAAWAVLIAGTAPYYLHWSTVAFVDIPFAAFLLVGLRWLVRWADDRAALAAGCLFGFALGIKYYAIPALAVALMCAVLLPSAERRALSARRLVRVLGPALAIGGGWYLRNWIVLGCPIFPPPVALQRWFATPTFPLAASRWLQHDVWLGYGGRSRALWALALLPFRLTLHFQTFNSADLGILPLALAPLALLRFRRLPRFWLAWTSVMTLFWFITDQDARFLMTPVAVWMVWAGMGAVAALEAPLPTLRRVALLAIAAALFLNTTSMVWNDGENWTRVHSLMDARLAHALWLREVPNGRALEFLNCTPQVQSVLVLQYKEPVFFLRKPYVKIEGTDHETPFGPISSEQAIAQLPRWHVTHVLDSVVPFGAPFQLPHPPANLALVFSTATARVYRVVGPWAP